MDSKPPSFYCLHCAAGFLSSHCSSLLTVNEGQKHGALTQDFLHSSVAVVLNLQQPSFDACKRLYSTDVVDDYDAVRTSIEPMTIKTHPPKLGNDCQLAYGFLVVFFNNFVPKTHHF